MPINDRSLSIAKLNEWSELGEACKKSLIEILGTIAVDIRRTKSPAKAVARSTKKLTRFFLNRSVHGALTETSSRRIAAQIFHPIRAESGLIFCHLNVEIIARSGQLKIKDDASIQISIHSLQRLIQRLNPESNEQVQDEIYSCINLAGIWAKSALKVDAKCWPLLSKNGFFIAASKDSTELSTLITWMTADTLSSKWKRVLVELLNLQKIKPELLLNAEYVEGFILCFPWMLHEHTPDVDEESLAWNAFREEQSLEGLNSTSPTKLSLDNDLVGGEEIGTIDLVRISKLSRTYRMGLNYKIGPPPFRSQSKFAGMVIQIDESSGMLVNLLNGWIGKISNHSRLREKIAGLNEPVSIGMIINVAVQRVIHLKSDAAWLINLEREELVEYHWMKAKSKYPLGFRCDGVVLSHSKAVCPVKIDKDVYGLIPTQQINWLITLSKKIITLEESNPTIEVEVVGYQELSRNLLLEIPNFRNIYFESISSSLEVGDILNGRFISKFNSTIYVSLGPSVTGLLSNLNSWDRELSNDNPEAPVRIIRISKENAEIHVGLLPPNEVKEARYFQHMPDESWEKFIALDHVDEVITVQVTSTFKDGYFCTLENGLVGLLRFKNIDWYSDIEKNKRIVQFGDLIRVKIIKVHKARKIYLDRRPLVSHPLVDGRITARVGDCFQGVVRTVMDYGYFVTMPFGLEALLHKSAINRECFFQEGELLDVEITSIDVISFRISLQLSNNV